MKTINVILIYMLLNVLGINAQTLVCKIDTTGWKRIPTILVNTDSVKSSSRTSYNTNSDMRIWFNTCLQLKYPNSPIHIKRNEITDLSNYNLIEIHYGFSACDMRLNYNLYRDKSGQPILIVNLIVPEERCKAMSSVYSDFLVLKKDCPTRPKVCILQHQIENK